MPFGLKAFACRSSGSAFVYLPLMIEATSTGVAEKIFGSWSFQDSSVIVFGNIDMNMIFIHNKCFRNDVQAFINFSREFLITVRKPVSQFLVRKSMLDDTCRKSGQIGFTFADSFLR